LTDTVIYCIADVRSYSDYYPYGMAMVGRNLNISDYRFGYQGSEMTNEMAGNGNEYTTYFRQLDPRLGRWFSTDPVVQPWQSPYMAMNANPITYNDPTGDAGNSIGAVVAKIKGQKHYNVTGKVRGKSKGKTHSGTRNNSKGTGRLKGTEEPKTGNQGKLTRTITGLIKKSGNFTNDIRDPQFIGLPEADKLVTDYTSEGNRRIEDNEYVSSNIDFRLNVPDLDGNPFTFDGAHDPTANIVPWSGPTYGSYQYGDRNYNVKNSLSYRVKILNPSWRSDYNGEASRAFRFLDAENGPDYKGLQKYMEQHPDKVFIRWPAYPSDPSGSKGWSYGVINNSRK